MGRCDAGKYSTYILELVRNNGITDEKECIKREDENTSCKYLLFDYFDLLDCRKLTGKDKKYLNYLSIQNVFEEDGQHAEDYKVSYKTLSLYCKSDNSDFFSIQREGQYLSKTPFLGIIQISLCRDNYIVKEESAIADIDIDAFLEERERNILSIADKYQSKHPEIEMRRALFRSSTTGDFCLAIRTNVIRLIYDIAIALNGTQNNYDESYRMLTFTNVGIECKYVEGRGYATLDANVISKNLERIALRFSADESVRKKLEEYIKKQKNTTVEGLFGRYEYLLTIGMEEFAALYPFLCESKLGRINESRSKNKLEQTLSDALARNINERILIELDQSIDTDAGTLSDEMLLKAKEKREKEREEVFNINKQLLNKIQDLKKYKNLFQEEHFAFQDLVRGMIEIYKSFSSAGMDQESYINWRVFHQDMDVLCQCIQEMMRNYQRWVKEEAREESDKKRYRGIILGDWRENLNAINRYTTLVQNVNYQTYQSPSYEIQTQIDAEKEMVAYREAMELYITNATDVLKAEMRDTKASQVYPLIYPDLSKDKVTVIAPFIVKKPDAAMPVREIICTVPSFEYFARLYDLLPWIIHETSHHLRVIDRETRNRFLTDYIFSYVFDAVMNEPLRSLSDCDFYKADGRDERFLTACMTEAAKEIIFKPDDFKQYNFEKLISEIEKWLKMLFPLGEGYDMAVYIEEEKQKREQTFQFWLDAYRKEQILDSGNLCTILKVWDQKISLTEKQELAKKLLEQYNKNLCNKLGDRAGDLKVSPRDMGNRALMEKKMEKLAAVEGDERVAAREYFEQIASLYRVLNSESKIPCENEEKISQYFKEVFELFQDNYKKEMMKNGRIVDTVYMHVMRNLALLHDDPDDSGDFVKEMKKIARTIDYTKVMEYLEIRKRIYLEAYADILMATSLRLTGFGYCRQVLQTVSDAKLTDREYGSEDINYERWRTVAAVLLVNPKDYLNLEDCMKPEASHELEMDEQMEVDARELLEQAEEYCEQMIRHISAKLANQKELAENEEKRANLRELLQIINSQMGEYLKGSEHNIREMMLLDVLLHGDQNVEDTTVKDVWEKCQNDVKEFCEDVKYNFWRLSCFCKGIVNIVKNGKITVSKKLFYHMLEIRETVYDQTKGECKWECKSHFLTDPKRDVGNFYNDPKQVCEKTPDQKLENTIDFIQNFYYYNRFRVVNSAIKLEDGNV